MAEHSILFKIGSIFKGEGYQKAMKSTKDLNTNVKQSAEMASQLAGAMGGLDTSAARAAGAMTGMLSSLMTLNATAIITQATTIGLTLYFDKMKESVAGLTERMNAMKAQVEKAFQSTLSDRINSIKTEVAALAGDFERITKEANAFTAAINGLKAAQGQGGVLALEVEKVNALLAAHGEAERQAIEQTYALKIAMEKMTVAQEAGAAKVAAAQAEIDANTKRQHIAREQLAKLEEERRSLEETMMTAKMSEDNRWLEIQKQVNILKEQEAALTTNTIALEEERQRLDVVLATAKQEALNSETQAKLAVDQVTLKNQQLSEALEKKKAAEIISTQETELKTAAEMTYTGEIKSAAEIQAEANAAARSLAAAQKDYEAKLREYNSAENLTKRAAQDFIGNPGTKLKGGLLPVDVQKGIQMTVADKAVDDAIRNGAVTTVKEVDQLQRQAMRESRDAISKNQRQQIREAQRYKRLEKMDPDKLASADRDFMTKYNKLLEHQQKQKEELTKSKDKMEEAVKEMKDINTKLKELGLK